MSIKRKAGRTVGAAVAFTAAVLMAQNASAMSELESLMGEPIEALSDNELSELRGGFVTVNGLKFNIGVEVSQAVNGRVRSSSAVLQSVAERANGVGRSYAWRRPDDVVEQSLSEEKTEQSIGGAPIRTKSSLAQVVFSSPETVAATTSDDGPQQNVALTDDTMTFSTEAPATAAPLELGSSTPAAMAGSIFDVQMAVIDDNNSNVLLNQVINLDIANYSVIDAMAARSRIESQIANVVNSQVLFQLGQQF